MQLCFIISIYSLWCWWYYIDYVNIFWICYCSCYFSIFVSSVDIGIIWFLIIGLCFYSILWTMFVSATSLYFMWCLGNDICEFNHFLSITYVDVFDFSVSICVVFFKVGFVSLIYIGCCCFYWFLWVRCDFDGWMFLWLITLRLSLMLLLFILSRCLKIKKMFWFHFFTLNHNYLTLFSLIFVLVTFIYLVWYIFISFICFPQNIFILRILLLIIVT